jgi:hypothetical protein
MVYYTQVNIFSKRVLCDFAHISDLDVSLGFFLCLVVGWNWVHLIRRPLIGLLYQPRMLMNMEHLVETETCSSVTLPATSPTWWPGIEPCNWPPELYSYIAYRSKTQPIRAQLLLHIPCALALTTISTKTSDVLSHIRLTWTALPWKRNPLVLGKQLMMSECWTMLKSARPFRQNQHFAFGLLVRILLFSLRYNLYSLI